MKRFALPSNQNSHTTELETRQPSPCHIRHPRWEGSAAMIRLYEWVPCFFFSNLLILTFSLATPASEQESSAQHGAKQSQQSQESAQRQPTSDPIAVVQSQPGQERADDQSTENHTQEQGTSPKNDRLFGVLPNYLTVENEAQVPPLTPGGKFKLVAKNAFDPAIFPFIGFLALVSQGQNSEPEFGQGAVGYGRRYGAAFGDATIGSFMTGAVFPAVFEQDPRYFQLVHGGLKRRAVYSVSRIFITRTDSGHSQFNSSEILGNLVAAGISNAYHPAQDRSFMNTLSVWGTDIGWDTIANLAEEFWPDIHHRLKEKFLARQPTSIPAR
jgi:hypothetical protein